MLGPWRNAAGPDADGLMADEASLNEGCAAIGLLLNDKKELLCRHQKEEPNAQALPPRYVAISSKTAFLQRQP